MKELVKPIYHRSSARDGGFIVVRNSTSALHTINDLREVSGESAKHRDLKMKALFSASHCLSGEIPVSRFPYPASRIPYDLVGLTAVLAYAVFEWGGVLRRNQYVFLLAVGLLAVGYGMRKIDFGTCDSRLGTNGLRSGKVTAERELLSIDGNLRGKAGDGVVPRSLLPIPFPYYLIFGVVLLPVYVLLQVLPAPIALLRVLSPQRAAAVDALTPIGARLNFAALSVSPGRTFQHFLLICGYISIFLLVRGLAWRQQERRWLTMAPIIALGALEASLGLWQNFGAGADRPRWGTYVNHNHYAGFLEMALPFAVMYPVAVLRRNHSSGYARARATLAACGVWALAAIMFAGIAFSFSRMGFVAALCSLLVIGVLALGNRRLSGVAPSPSWPRRVAAISAVVALAGSLFAAPDKLILRYAQVASVGGFRADIRASVWPETISLIKAYPVVGCGLGGYESAFAKLGNEPLYTIDFAHNDYLQLLAELGLPGFLIVALLGLGITRAAFTTAIFSRDQERRFLSVACAGALAAILLHSVSDFNLYIPANAMLLAWIAGLTAANEIQASGATAASDTIARAGSQQKHLGLLIFRR